MASDQIKVILAAHKPPPFQLAFVNSHSRHFPPFGTMSKQQPAFRQPQQHHYKHNDNNLSTMQPTPAIARFIEIPEMVGHLARHHLDHKSISRLMRTSRQMYAFCTPTFYYNIYAGYRHGRRNLFASKESIDALGRNVDLVRVLELHMLDMVYYINCVFASQDQPSTLPPPAPADTSSSTGEQEVWTKVSRRPWRLALPDSQIYTVHPMPPMTLLTRLNLNLDFFDALDDCPYLLPPYMDPRATLTQVCWILDLNPHLLDLTLECVLMKDHRDIRLLSKALFELKQLQKAKFDFIRLEGMKNELEESGGTAERGLTLPVFFACPPALRTLYVTVARGDQVRWLEEYGLDMMMSEHSALRPGQPLSWEIGHDDNEEEEEEDNEQATTAVPRLRQEPMVHMRSLNLCCMGESLSEVKFRSILAHCPNLTTIAVPPIHSIQHPQQLAQEIAQLCPKLINLEEDYFDSNKASWELLFRILEALPEQQVQRFDWRAQSFLIPGLTSEVAGSLFRRHSTTLREIVLAGCWNIDSKVIQTILVECWALERLEVQFKPLEGPNYQQQQQPLCISLEDAIEFTWGCARIQDLNLAIAIPDEPLHRSKEMGVVPYYNRPPPTTLSPAETAQFQSLEAFYRQIGALTELEHLKLKAIFYDPAGTRFVNTIFKFKSFPGMLNLENEETGRPGYLQLLGGLTKLKTLLGSISATTEETKATIGMNEVKWMDKYWPALKKARFFTIRNEMLFSEPFKWLLTQRAGGKKILRLAPSV